MKLKGKAALVTGAGGGLGSAIAKRFAAEGASVLCTDLELEKAEFTVTAITKNGGTANALAANVADSDDSQAQVDQTINR